MREGLAAVYDSAAAARYRAGCAACSGCAIRPVCGGCLAVAHGFGLDPLRERDPLCFLGESEPRDARGASLARARRRPRARGRWRPLRATAGVDRAGRPAAVR